MEIRAGLKLLKEAGMRKINFAGGEPFLYPNELAMLCRYCKEDLQMESVSIISNGTLIKKKWLEEHGRWIDVLGVSCDSFNEKTNIAIGRGSGKNVEQLFDIRQWCRELGIKFKLNTVVCTLNWQEKHGFHRRWARAVQTKDDKRKRDARKLLISKDQFDTFCGNHQYIPSFVPESNDLMASSYLILDEYLCFLDKGSGKEVQSGCILKVGVEQALKEIKWDREAFVKRGREYDWAKGVAGGDNGCGKSVPKELEF
ncbi:hypothetical protein LTR36_006045 [Oleoguttula mirabilis]|uniref:Radical SAM core domain-containing protein n=1 Tax=Oleoguttula mirabilis TaxID=1507867 RepID=A0AAV9JCN1_9PEZI|nr:hypothetical protein LTR36_006045 [Oleoguttula mirabilis]